MAPSIRAAKRDLWLALVPYFILLAISLTYFLADGVSLLTLRGVDVALALVGLVTLQIASTSSTHVPSLRALVVRPRLTLRTSGIILAGTIVALLAAHGLGLLFTMADESMMTMYRLEGESLGEALRQNAEAVRGLGMLFVGAATAVSTPARRGRPRRARARKLSPTRAPAKRFGTRAPRGAMHEPGSTDPSATSGPDTGALAAGLCGDPRGVLGPLGPGPGARIRVRAFFPGARGVEAVDAGRSIPLERIHEAGIFEGPAPSPAYRLRVRWPDREVELDDPYRFAPRLAAADFEAFRAGTETLLHRLLGAHLEERDGVAGTRFAVWAPRALAVNLMGSFNAWEARRNPMVPIPGAGVWELFVPGVGPGALYKFQVRAPDPEDGETILALDKTDPLGFCMEVRPRSASIVVGEPGHPWNDAAWLKARGDRVAPGRPVSIYEVHPGSWARNEDGSWLGYRALAGRLLPWVREMGFTHIELLPITEHPHDASWGYQTTGYFALTSRYGGPDDFRAFVDEAHRMEIGVIADWVPAHFPLDLHGLARFDGAPLYEHADPRRGAHPDWGTAIFDYGRPEVISFLMSSARFWLDAYHIDGFRVDAVASMLYLDYSRDAGEWEPNEYGGRENLEAVEFLKRLNETLHDVVPGVVTCAEESTAWPGVTAPVDEGGLGFDFKWNMGWMNDTLRYMGLHPLRRPAEHRLLTFSMHYAYNERYLLPLSHDEVVHLKKSLLSRMPGSYDEKFAGLRLLFGFMWAHPGAKLLFMGGEIGSWSEWSEAGSVPWEALELPAHAGVRDWVATLNRLYRDRPELHALDHEPAGFEWLDVHDAARSVLSWVRRAADPNRFLVVVANFSDEPRRGYRVAVPRPGSYELLAASDDPAFGGRGALVVAGDAERVPLHGRPASLVVDLPPLSLALLAPADAHAPPGPPQPA